MKHACVRLSALTFVAAGALAGCTQHPRTSDASPAPVAATAAQEVPLEASSPSPARLPLVVVNKTPTCGCCGAWVEHMQKAGFTVEVRNLDDLNPIKEQLGVPYGKGSCHTAEVEGYFVEGHVPAEDVKRLLREKPTAKGLTVPGMPLGSPGMEVPDGTVQPYVVELVAHDGTASEFARHGH